MACLEQTISYSCDYDYEIEIERQMQGTMHGFDHHHCCDSVHHHPNNSHSMDGQWMHGVLAKDEMNDAKWWQSDLIVMTSHIRDKADHHHDHYHCAQQRRLQRWHLVPPSYHRHHVSFHGERCWPNFEVEPSQKD